MAGMGFAIDHSESSPEVVQVVVESLALLETPVPTKIARLFLISGMQREGVMLFGSYCLFVNRYFA